MARSRPRGQRQRCDHTVYEGLELQGAPRLVFRRGEAVAADGRVEADAGPGIFLAAAPGGEAMAEAVDGVLLAAGCSSRAGTFKMTAEVGGKPLLPWGLEAMAAVCGRVIVVAGSAGGKDPPAWSPAAPGSSWCVNEHFAAGMLSSVQAGAARVRAPRFFLLPGDMPLVRAAVYREAAGARRRHRRPGLRRPPRPPGAAGELA